ncbi:B box and SPRY domain-containing protein isoform X2 [Corythoichthys intestinalis]|uniref:B box and SPRY domain-containing protein isoform X2 n=1 Tax=Corythoichthys intestinalis TaxID=161448 RepID=UPI0025A54723|nr:B box and SPRY domain-containing protein isoform X2 [Corythoichthys intestinalis]
MMTEALTDLTAAKDGVETSTMVKSEDMSHAEQPIFNALGRDNSAAREKPNSGTKAPAAIAMMSTASDTESGIFSAESEMCVEHEYELDCFCQTDMKVICTHCAVVGSCQGHSVTPLADRVTAVRNQLVDACEKMQLQALRIEKFIEQTLTGKEKKLQVAASTARERVVAQVSVAREALEEEEQRLLEEVQQEEERVEQCLLTQRAHWAQAMASLARTRSRLVHTLTHAPDAQLVTSIQEIAERVEEAEGVGEPYDTEQLNMKPCCSDSHLLRGMWATAMLNGSNTHGLSSLKFDERTANPLLLLSDDRCSLTFLQKKPRQTPPYDPARFDSWPNALGSLSLSSGTHSWKLDVGHSAAFKVGVCYASLHRKGSGDEARLGHNDQSWVLSHYNGEYSFWHAGEKVMLQVATRPQKVGVLLDWPSQTLLFYEPESACVLHCAAYDFSAPLLPAFAVTDQSITIVH